MHFGTRVGERVLGLVITALLVVVSTTSAAHAVEPGCILKLSPGPGTRVPANTPALTYWVRRDGADSAGGPPTELVLLNASGDEIPYDIEPNGEYGFLLVPRVPFEPGRRYQVRFPNPCFGGKQVFSFFDVDEEAPLPNGTGTVHPEPIPDDQNVRFTCSGEEQFVDVPAIRLTMEVDPSLTPFLPVTRFTSYVDGKPWGRTFYGDQRASFWPQPFFRLMDVFYATCGVEPMPGKTGDPCDVRPADLGPGRHKIEIRPEIAGLDRVVPPIRTDLELVCSGGFPADAGAPPDGGEPDFVWHAGEGCVCQAGGRATSAPAALVLVAFAFVSRAVAGRRRRARRP